jgi:ABC-type nitrate/sulfonate/bicarbonate transport system permease component
MLPPILAIASVLAVWWGLYLIFPRLLPGPVSTFNEAIRLLSDGTFFFHMLQSLRRVFVGAAVAMIFSIAIGIYMGTVLMGERFFPTAGGLRTHDSGFDVGADRGNALRDQ